MAEHETLTASYVRSILDYNPETGELRWVRNWSPRALKDMEAGAKDRKGYIRIMLHKKSYAAHRLAWLLMTGEWPETQIDHIDMDKSNNRYSNLRVASHSQNMFNRSAQKNNKLGVKGVSWALKSKKFHAQIKIDGKQINLGYFDSLAEAESAYAVASKKLHGEFARAA
jgi:hypothetical protein